MYYTTTYFVDPEIICNGGRSQIEFNQQGTGYRIAMQNGPDPLSDLVEIPLSQADMNNEVKINTHFIHISMHTFFTWNNDDA